MTDTSSTDSGTSINAEDLIKACKEFQEKLVSQTLGLSRIIVTPDAKKQQGWNFNPSPHRSARLHKKLLKRYGTQEKWVPAFMKLPDGTLLVPPALEASIRQLQPAPESEVRYGFHGSIGRLRGVPVFFS